MSKIKKSKVETILNSIAEILLNVSQNNGLYVNYAKIYYGAMEFLYDSMNGEAIKFPVDISCLYEKLDIAVEKENLNEFMGDEDPKKINRIIGKISIRPDYGKRGTKKTIYVDEKAAPSMVNYALAHELAHLILNYSQKRYTDEYCTMPMLPKNLDEIVADAFAIFLMIPFDVFLETFKEYITIKKNLGDLPITTEDWLNYLGSVTTIPYYYVACAYHQIRHVAYLMHYIHTNEKVRASGEKTYGKEVMLLYDKVKEKLDDEILDFLYQ